MSDISPSLLDYRFLTLLTLAILVRRLIPPGRFALYGAVSSVLLIGLASLPFALTAPLALLTAAVGGAGGVALLVMCLAALGVWSLVLAVMGVRRAYYLSGGGAAVSVLAPWPLMVLPMFGAIVIHVFCQIVLIGLSLAATAGQLA